jgi:LacI family transcriptional regulator
MLAQSIAPTGVHLSHLSLKSFARIVGFSETTVSRVLNHKAAAYRISKKTEETIVRRAQELGFSPDHLAASLRTHKTFTIGLILPDISNPFFAGIAGTVQIEARKRGYAVLLAESQENSAIEKNALAGLVQRHVDGFVILPVGQVHQHITDLYHQGHAAVIIDRYFPDSDVPFVTSDNYRGAVDAIDYMIECGHRHIACIQGFPYAMPTIERVRGYRDALGRADLPVREEWIVGDSYSEENGYLETKLLLKETFVPTALFALGNLIALGALRAIKEEKLAVPQDISLISFDDQPYSNFLATPMTTVSQQTSEMGKIAMNLLLRQMQDKERVEEGIKLPTTLIIRSSVQIIINNRLQRKQGGEIE